MRYLLAILALTACASDPDSTPYAGTNDASASQCPLIGRAGVTGASQLSDGRCAYRCSSAYRRCGTVIPDDGGAVIDWGVCTPYSDPQNCGDCGVRCASNETCRVTSTSRGQYICTTSMLP